MYGCAVNPRACRYAMTVAFDFESDDLGLESLVP